jgi:hypothetical protein
MPVIPHSGLYGSVWAYALLTVFALAAIALVYPPLFKAIVDTIAQLIRALSRPAGPICFAMLSQRLISYSRGIPCPSAVN